MSSTQIIVLVVVIVVVLALILFGYMAARRAALRRQFGPEYDRVVQEQGGRMPAERELRERERRHAELNIRPLSQEAQARYTAQWEQVQARFVDTPAEAVGEADALVTHVMADRGYPTGEFDEQAANMSVEHGRALGHYRDAHELSLRSERGEATTEQLRQALVHYRALFADLLGLEPEQYVGAAAGTPAPSVNGASTEAGTATRPAEQDAAAADAQAQPAQADAEAVDSKERTHRHA